MRRFLSSLLGKIPPVAQIPLMVFAGLLLIALVWLYGMRAWNGVGNFMYHHSVNDATREIDQTKQQVASEKELANQAVAAYESSKLVIAEKEKQLEIAEKELADKRKNTDQKLAAYEAAVNSRPTVTEPQSTHEMCLRAKALGISVTCQ